MFPCACAGALLVPAVLISFRGCTTTPRFNRSLRPEFSRIPVPRSRLRIPIQRIQSRERSRPQACGSERSRRPAPWQSHANRIQRRESERSLRGSICRARSGPRRGLTPPSRPTAVPSLRHTEAVDGGVCPLRRKRRLGLKGPSRARPPAPSQPSTDSPTHTTFEASPKPDVPLHLRRSSACSRRSYQLPRR